MIQVDERVFNQDVERINKLISDADAWLNKSSVHLMRQALVFSLQSAAKATLPGKGTSLSRLAKKHRIRPLVKITDAHYYITEDNAIFRVTKKLKPSEVRRRKLRKATKGIKYWDKKAQKFRVTPYDEQVAATQEIKREIPGAGAAKAAWLQAYGKLTGKTVDTKGIKSVLQTTKMTDDFAEVLNRVDYAAKTSPRAAIVGVEKARKRMEKIWLPKIEKSIERTFNNATNTFIKTLTRLT